MGSDTFDATNYATNEKQEKDILITKIKAVSQFLYDNAADLVGACETVTGFWLSLDFPTDGLPEVSVNRTHTVITNNYISNDNYTDKRYIVGKGDPIDSDTVQYGTEEEVLIRHSKGYFMLNGQDENKKNPPGDISVEVRVPDQNKVEVPDDVANALIEDMRDLATNAEKTMEQLKADITRDMNVCIDALNQVGISKDDLNAGLKRAVETTNSMMGRMPQPDIIAGVDLSQVVDKSPLPLKPEEENNEPYNLLNEEVFY